MTEAQYIKTFAHQLYTRFHNLGITHNKAQNAAITCVLAMVDQYLKMTNDPPDKIKAQQERFTRLIGDINAYFACLNYVEVHIDEIAKIKECKPYDLRIMGYISPVTPIEVSIEEIAALKGCKKDQILIIY